MASEPPSKKSRMPEFRVEAIVDPSLRVPELPLMEYFVIPVTDKKQIGKLLRVLAKRVCASKDSTEILLSPVDCSEDIRCNLIKEIQDTVGIELTDFPIRKIPAVPPRTRAQFEWAKSYWSVAFREDKGLEAKIAGSEFDYEIIEGFRERVEILNEWADNSETIRNAAIFVEGSEVIASCSDLRRPEDPLAHAVMNGLDSVAKAQGGGARGNRSQGVVIIREHWDESSYLATGMDCFLLREPCAMCAMALLHSRISRVFYVLPQPQGALGSALSLHIHPSLNHHFDVYRVYAE